MKSLRTFFGYGEFSLKRIFMYRVYLVSEVIGGLLVPIIINLFLWRSLLSTNEILYSFPEILRYITVSNLVMLFTQIHVEDELKIDVKTYRLGQKILHPVGYLTDLLYRQVSASLIKLVTVYLPLIVMILILTDSIFQQNIVYIIVALGLGFTMNALFSFIIGCLSFWLTEIWGIAAIRNLLFGLFAGSLFPLDILSQSVQKVLLRTPFPYMAYIPTKLISDSSFDVSILTENLPIALGWTLLLSIIAIGAWKLGLKKYTSAGA